MKIRSRHFVSPIIGKTRAVMIACLIGAGVSFGVTAQTITDLQRGFARPPDDARVMMRWWWFGPAVTKAELEREMRLMKEGGIGGFEVQATYPLQLEGNMRYMSPEFLELLRFTGEKAKELGLRMDLTLGSGWPYGGPHIPIELPSGGVGGGGKREKSTRAPAPAGRVSRGRAAGEV